MNWLISWETFWQDFSGKHRKLASDGLVQHIYIIMKCRLRYKAQIINLLAQKVTFLPLEEKEKSPAVVIYVDEGGGVCTKQRQLIWMFSTVQ